MCERKGEKEKQASGYINPIEIFSANFLIVGFFLIREGLE